MLYAVFLASLGVIGSLVVFLFWQTRRAASASDECLSAVKKSGELDLALAARGRAVEDRDQTIRGLEIEVQHLEAALETAQAQRDALVANMNPKDSKAAVDAIKNALAPHPPAGVLPHVPKAPTPGTTPHR